MSTSLKVIVATIVLTFAALTSAATAGAATSGAHFFNVASSVNDSGALLVTYDEAGVGNATVDYTINITDASAVYACINGGGNHPKAANKETVSGGLTVGFSIDPKNGRVTGATSPPIGPQPVGAFSCPSGQTLVLASVSYTGITLTDTTNGVSTAVPDASRTFVDIR
jgi:hypothetical protein